WVRRDSRGRYYVLFAYATTIKVFDAQGRFLRTVGRKGAGPGEFEGATGLYVSDADTLHVLGWGTSRHSVFAPDFSFVRSNPLALQPQLQWQMLPDARVVLNVDIRSPDLIGIPLHLLGVDGALVRSFGSETGAYR